MESRLDPTSQARVDRLLELLAKARPLIGGTSEPCFGHMRIQTQGRTRDLLLGRGTVSNSSVAVIDWQRSPLAEAFFGCEEGEEYEIDDGARSATGTLLERNLLFFDRGELSAILAPLGELRRDEKGRWSRSPRRLPSIAPRAPEARSSLEIEITLDEAQTRAVELPAGRTLLALGEAGCGKTTVALHRLARLQRASRGQLRAAVIVPTEGLRRLIETLLERLGARAEVFLYDRWACEQARRAFADLPSRESESASAGVMRIKRHPGLRELLVELAGRAPAQFDDESSRQTRSKALATCADLQYLFGDRLLMERLAAADPTVSARMVAETLEHTRVQFCERAEDEYSYVDPERLATLDGREIDEGTPMEDAATVDAEDYAVLFELDRLRAKARGGRAAEPKSWDLLVLDEAQELAPLELALIGRSLAPGGTLIVAGDAGQQVDPTVAFRGWDESLRELGARDYETATLEIGYRCPPQVTELARHVLDPQRAVVPVDASCIVRSTFGNECHLIAWLTDALRAMREEDAAAPVAVICRTPESARRIAGLLRRGLGVRLALDGRFDPRAGVDVTCVQEVKGLELDTVIIPDASASDYPDTPASRRALYVALTRASRQLVLSAVGDWSPLLAC